MSTPVVQVLLALMALDLVAVGAQELVRLSVAVEHTGQGKIGVASAVLAVLVPVALDMIELESTRVIEATRHANTAK
jgi:carbohydrate-binding DOMON domain-containing protein